LALGLVKTMMEGRVMACNPDYRSPTKLKMGGKVTLKPREGLYVFEMLTLMNRLKHWISTSWRSKGKKAKNEKQKK
jgi:hypothetical protein